jgi:hypothetical protein
VYILVGRSAIQKVISGRTICTSQKRVKYNYEEITKGRKPVPDQIVTEWPPRVKPLTARERKQALKVIEEARQLRMAMRKRRKGKLLPDSTPMIRQSREEELD